MRLLHTMLRVNNLEESVKFYEKFFGKTDSLSKVRMKINFTS